MKYLKHKLYRISKEEFVLMKVGALLGDSVLLPSLGLLSLSLNEPHRITIKLSKFLICFITIIIIVGLIKIGEQEDSMSEFGVCF